MVWNWLQSDEEARDFLSGKPDPWGMRVNSYFQELNLAENTSLSDFPKSGPDESAAPSTRGLRPARSSPPTR